jgi:DNA-binding transcriptional LysR family regulator
VLSDTLHPDVLEDLLAQFDRRFPHTEFECLIGEDEDVIDLLQKERAQVGLIEARDSYPTEIGSIRLPMQTEMAIFVAPGIRWRRRAASPGMSCSAGASCA